MTPPRYRATAVPGRAVAVPVARWQLRSSTEAGGTSAEVGRSVSHPGFDARGWYVAPARSTVMAALVDNGRYRDLERSTRLADEVDRREVRQAWWYRTTFFLSGDEHTTIEVAGVVSSADVFVNGERVATRDEVRGASTTHRFDVSSLVGEGTNALALCVSTRGPLEDFSLSWVDWNQWPPDDNLGIFRDVLVRRTGPLAFRSCQVQTRLALPSLETAELTVVAELENLADRPVSGGLSGRLSGGSDPIALSRRVRLGAGETAVVRFTPADTPALCLAKPRLWWPAAEGEQHLYDLRLTLAEEDGLVSDQTWRRFGVRSVESRMEEGGGRRFSVNGRELQIMGGGWAPDLFLRHDERRLRDELAYVLDLGLDTVRLEGKLENPEFFAAADEMGVLVLPGWECCSKWEGEKGDQGADWVEGDLEVAAASMASEAVRLRDHPSVLAFLIGSDFAPHPRTAERYVEELAKAAWPLPVVSSATTEGTEAAGPSGMKMTGPYDWVPPVYWYSRDARYGGAVGFNSETGTGNTIPRLANLRRMLSDEELEHLWREPEAKQFHAGPESVFDNLAVFHGALSARYGAPVSLEDFVAKAQLANYEASRAQFEAYRSRDGERQPATGMIYWMLNSAWPSLNWQLYDWYLDPGGAYFGAKKANERLHPLYAYDTGAVLVLNRERTATGPLEVTVTARDLSGAVLSSRRVPLERVEARGCAEAGRVSCPEGVEGAYFVSLELTTAAGAGSRNVYWLSSAADEPDFESTTWQYTPTRRFADLRGLAGLPPAEVRCEVETSVSLGWATSRLLLRNESPRGTPAVGLHAALGCARGPVFWSDNELVLFAGESATLEGRYPAALGGEGLVLEGFNVASRPLSPG